ncbi:hypothetical protein V8F33_012013 [Rhypophila sp. PSN 637]
MSRQNGAGNGIRGPHSALTDFLASHNISANQIRRDAEARRRAAAADGAPANQTEQQEEEDDDDDVVLPRPRGRRVAAVTGEEKRKKENKEIIDKIKAKKSFQKRKRLNDSDDGDEEELLGTLFKQRAAPLPLPGQMDNCAACGKRFTVTPYSRNSPDGGLLCTPCGKELAKDAAPAKRKPKRPTTGTGVGRRRQIASAVLDGSYHPGAKSLVTLCIQTLAKNIDLAEDLGELHPMVVDKIARKLSKHRLVDPRTLNLFLQSTAEEVNIYDGGKLSSDDFIKIFQTVPNLKQLKIRNAVHFKDEVMDYLLTRNIELEDFYLHGANLLSSEHWKKFLRKRGKSLKSLRVYWTDKHFGDDVLAELGECCPSLERLKVSHNQAVTGEGVKSIAKVKSLRHVSLELRKSVHPDIFVHLLEKIGHDLQTFSITRVPNADNTILDAAHNHCRSLRKLRITDSEAMTDEGFVRLFTGWLNPGLEFIDLNNCRQIDSAHPRSNPDNVGLCSNGFQAMMAHSRKAKYISVQGCRHITAEAFEKSFSATTVYPEMKKLEISFCEEVNDFIVGSIFRSCAAQLRELVVFGCMKVRDVVVPHGKLLIGVPNALGMVIDGNDD